MQSLRDIPKFEAISARVRLVPGADPKPVETFLMLLRIATDAQAAIDAYLARNGMSHGRLTLMAVLNRNPQAPASPTHLAEQCGVSRATITGLIDGLERDKLVQRDPHQADRRKMQVRLTPEGTQYLDSILPQYYRRITRLMAHLAPPETATLEEMLAKINAGIPAISSP
jgi:DNA-binding MarR family transcriptional regulator